ncbi:MAG TPA: hypothetical protein DDW19_01815 [Anaerolineaceae bacterium]|jgi:hypothetical protein|nr:hypothetical protein [Anaerolineaceae bacterium]
MGVSVLSSVSKTASSGTITAPGDCDYIVALVKGSTVPVVINGIAMTVKAAVEETEGIIPVSVQILRLPLTLVAVPYSFLGTAVVFVYLAGGVCTRPDAVQEFVDSGSYAEDLDTSTDDQVFAIVASNSGPLTLTGDAGAFTLVINESTCLAGYVTPGDAVMSLAGSAPNTSSSYWYQPPRVWVEGELIEAAHWEYVGTWIPGQWVVDPLFGQPGHPSEYVWVDGYYEYEAVWVEAEYSAGYWRYPPQVLVNESTPAKISLAAASIADVMVGSTYTSRPRHF